jgi:hypothetical protein
VRDHRQLLHPGLADWRMAGRGGFRWTAAGAIESYGGPGLLWYAAETFDDFVLEATWRITREDDNSGIFLRSPELGDNLAPAIERGYEVQIDDRGVDPETGRLGSPLHRTGAIYKLAPAPLLLSRAVGRWNTFTITARGSSIQVELNGRDASRLEDPSRERSGHIALQCHHEGSCVQFKSLTVSDAD